MFKITTQKNFQSKRYDFHINEWCTACPPAAMNIVRNGKLYFGLTVSCIFVIFGAFTRGKSS